MPELDEADRAARLLRQIALALNIPVERLLSPVDDEGGGSDIEQAVELLRLFGLVREGQARQRCLAFVRCAAGMSIETSADPVRGAA